MVSALHETDATDRRCFDSRWCGRSPRERSCALHVRSLHRRHRLRLCLRSSRWYYGGSTATFQAMDHSPFDCPVVSRRMGRISLVGQSAWFVSQPSKQTMKPTAPDRKTMNMFATDPAHGLSLSR